MAMRESTRESGFRDQLGALYQDYRKALLNVRCTQVRLARLNAVRTSLDLLLVATSFGALAAWWLWETADGQRAWTVLVILTALIALLRVVLPLTGRIERLERLREGYQTLFDDLDRIVERVRVQQSLDLEFVRLWSEALKRQERGTAGGGRGLTFGRRLVQRCEEDVEKQIPVRGLWMPQADVSTIGIEAAVCQRAAAEDGGSQEAESSSCGS